MFNIVNLSNASKLFWCILTKSHFVSHLYVDAVGGFRAKVDGIFEGALLAVSVRIPGPFPYLGVWQDGEQVRYFGKYVRVIGSMDRLILVTGVPWLQIHIKYVFRFRINVVNNVLYISFPKFCSPKFWVSRFISFSGKQTSFLYL